MFETAFISEMISLGNDKQKTREVWEEIAKKYREPTRYYHTLQHLEHMYQDLSEVKENISDWQTVIFSTAFHDVIYNPLKTDNEEQSAAFAETKLKEAGCTHTQIQKCKNLILATKTHQPTTETDTNYFTDADLTILGSPSQKYLSYAHNIRKEYRHYPDPVYSAGRKEVLKRFLKMPQIFKTPYFSNKYELQAKINLKDELTSLYNA